MPDRPRFNGDSYNHRYYVGLEGYRYPEAIARYLKVDPQTVIPEPSAIVMTLQETRRFTVAQLSRAAETLSRCADLRGFPGLGLYWRYTKPELERLLASSATRQGFTLVPANYQGY